MELGCHVAGMLDRDQRTAKFCVRDSRSSTSSSQKSTSCSCGDSYRSIGTQSRRLRNQDSGVSHTIPGRTSPSTFRIREKEHRHFWVTTLSRLHRTVLLCFYLSLFAFPKTSSAPVNMEKWMIPCGKSEARSSSNQIELLQAIIEQSKRSLVKMENVRDKFAMNVFGSNWSEVQGFGLGSLNWFPKIEKELGKPLTPDELDKIELKPLLKDTYQYLQIIAVAVDQMIIDEEQSKGPLLKDYKEQMESYVLSVLCEIQTATNTLNVPRHKDVERTIVDETDKNGDSTAMMTRHYMIIRDYLRLLEYIIECYEHVKSTL